MPSIQSQAFVAPARLVAPILAAALVLPAAGFLSAVRAAAAAAPAVDAPADPPASGQDASLHWTKLPSLPDPHGVPGAFAGEVGGALVVAGGSNFPDGPPWEGGTKRWRDEIHILVLPGPRAAPEGLTVHSLHSLAGLRRGQESSLRRFT